MQDLHGELKEMLQDETDTSSLTQYAQELVKPDLMKHSDKVCPFSPRLFSLPSSVTQ